ncbi:MAG: T9SS type A sorting domain-containing protein, partial [Bacteroidales bacterium]
FEYWISKGDSVYLDQACNIGGGYGNTIYEWHPSLGLSDTTLVSGFWAKPDTSIAYTATIIDSKGCRQTAGGPLYYVYVNTVNISRADLIPLEIFPNPTDGLIYFKSNNQHKIKMLKVYTSTGMELMSLNNPVNVLDISGYKSGMYIIEFYFDEGLVTQKIIKK